MNAVITLRFHENLEQIIIGRMPFLALGKFNRIKIGLLLLFERENHIEVADFIMAKTGHC